MTFGNALHELVMENSLEALEAKLRTGIETVFERTHQTWQKANETVRGLLGAAQGIDEMALYFPHSSLLALYLSLAVQRDWSLFNYAEDNVTARPIPGNYAVEYWFLQHSDRPYRMELMTIQKGFSPLHASMNRSMNNVNSPVTLAHASFKVADEAAYGAAVLALRKAGYDLAQHCESSYGRFSYFLDGEPPFVALKPRINLRDNNHDL